MESISKLTFLFINVILFLFSVSIFFSLSKNYSLLLEKSKRILEDSPIIYQQDYDQADPEINYEELIALLFYKLEYDIQINDRMIQKEEHDISKIESYNIESTKYTYESFYNEENTLQLVIFTSIGS